MKYDIILCDPPWSFQTYSEKGKEKKSPETHYDCMSIDDIYNLPVKDLASEHCTLFLWVTNPMFPEGLETIKRWGFTYKTVAFTWFKKNKIADSFFWGLGYWTRANTENCLLATIGKPTRINKGIHQIIDGLDTEQVYTRIQAHSKKPDEVRNKIVALRGDLPRVELFGRGEAAPGWDIFGNESVNSIDWRIE